MRRIKSMMAGALFLVTVPCWTVEVGSCKQCLQDVSHWDCVGGEGSGGTGCSLQGDSCTVSGICGGGIGTMAFFSAKLSPDLIREIATFSPRLAASVWNLAAEGKIESPSLIYWTDGPIAASDVEALLKGKPIRFKNIRRGSVTYRAEVQEGPQGALELVISPLSLSKLDPKFKALVIPLESDKSDRSSGYSAKTWQIF